MSYKNFIVRSLLLIAGYTLAYFYFEAIMPSPSSYIIWLALVGYVVVCSGAILIVQWRHDHTKQKLCQSNT